MAHVESRSIARANIQVAQQNRKWQVTVTEFRLRHERILHPVGGFDRLKECWIAPRRIADRRPRQNVGANFLSEVVFVGPVARHPGEKNRALELAGFFCESIAEGECAVFLFKREWIVGVDHQRNRPGRINQPVQPSEAVEAGNPISKLGREFGSEQAIGGFAGGDCGLRKANIAEAVPLEAGALGIQNPLQREGGRDDEKEA